MSLSMNDEYCDVIVCVPHAPTTKLSVYKSHYYSHHLENTAQTIRFLHSGRLLLYWKTCPAVNSKLLRFLPLLLTKKKQHFPSLQ